MNIILQDIKTLFSRIETQRALQKLYKISEYECKRNGKIGMEIGLHREKDLVSILKMGLGDKVNENIDKDATEDVIINGLKFSIKHSMNKYSGVKYKWSSSKESTEDILEGKKEYINMIIVYVLQTKVELFVVSADTINKYLQKSEALKVPKGNSRGVEFTRSCMKSLIQECELNINFEIDINQHFENPIDKRISYLKSLGISI